MTCYVLDGSVADLLWPCNNSTDAHSTCCPADSTCWSNGVCMYEPDDGPTDYLRAGCTDPTWNDPACLKECEDFSPEKIIGIRPCDGIEKGTDYCCDDGSKGAGSFHCCQTQSEIFTVSDSAPTILAEMPLTWTMPAEDMTATPGSAETSTSGASSGPSASSDDSDDSGSGTSLGVPVGVGVGVGLPAAALIIGAGFFFARRRKRAAAAPSPRALDTAQTEPLEPKHPPPHGPGYDGQVPPGYGQSPIYPSADPVYGHQTPGYASPQTTGYVSPQSPAYAQPQQAPVELGGSQPAKHELA